MNLCIRSSPVDINALIEEKSEHERERGEEERERSEPLLCVCIDIHIDEI